MRIIAAYLLAVLGGNDKPTAANVTAILDAAGVQADEAKLTKFFTEIEGKTVDELIAQGEALLATKPAAGGSGSGSASGSGSGSASGSGAASGSGSGSGSGSSSGSGAGGAGMSLFD